MCKFTQELLIRYTRIAYYSLVQALMKLEVFQKRFDDYFKEFGNYQKMV